MRNLTDATRPVAVQPMLFDSIQRKQSSVCGPYQATADMARLTQTDMNEFPYRRFYRGNPDSDLPHVFDREAGFRKIRDTQFQVIANPFASANFCFQAPCSTIFPCDPISNPYFNMPTRCVWVSP